MTDSDREHHVIEAFIGFADRLVEDFDVLDLMIQLADDCARLLDIEAAGLLLADAGGVLHLLASTSEHARSLELFQLQRDEGPCLDCYRTGRTVNVADLHAESRRWPQFEAAAAERGFLSAHAIPMRLNGQTLGALGLFGSTARDLAMNDLRLAQALVHVASIALVQQERGDDLTSLLPTLQSTIESRRLLEIAKGVLAEVHTLSMEDASHRLRSYARQRHQRLTDVARAVVSVTDPRQPQLLADLGEVSDVFPRSARAVEE